MHLYSVSAHITHIFHPMSGGQPVLYNISVSCKNGMSTETTLHSKVKPRYHKEGNPGDKG